MNGVILGRDVVMIIASVLFGEGVTVQEVIDEHLIRGFTGGVDCDCLMNCRSDIEPEDFRDYLRGNVRFGPQEIPHVLFQLSRSSLVFLHGLSGSGSSQSEKGSSCRIRIVSGNELLVLRLQWCLVLAPIQQLGVCFRYWIPDRYSSNRCPTLWQKGWIQAKLNSLFHVSLRTFSFSLSWMRFQIIFLASSRFRILTSSGGTDSR
ncbi:hypothetical protein Tco_1155053 [Tanacetum coccineum]